MLKWTYNNVYSPTLRRASVKSWVTMGKGSLNISYNTSSKPFCRANYIWAVTLNRNGKSSTKLIMLLLSNALYKMFEASSVCPRSQTKENDNYSVEHLCLTLCSTQTQENTSVVQLICKVILETTAKVKWMLRQSPQKWSTGQGNLKLNQFSAQLF